MKKFTIGFLVFAMVVIGTIFAFAQKGEKGKHGRGFGLVDLSEWRRS